MLPASCAAAQASVASMNRVVNKIFFISETSAEISAVAVTTWRRKF
jgi:hypothetical protein